MGIFLIVLMIILYQKNTGFAIEKEKHIFTKPIFAY